MYRQIVYSQVLILVPAVHEAALSVKTTEMWKYMPKVDDGESNTKMGLGSYGDLLH